MLVLKIIDVLKKYSSTERPLTQSEILNILQKEYGIRPDRKTLRSALNDLVKLYDGAEYSDFGQKGWYIRGMLTEYESETVMRALLFSPEAERSVIESVSDKLSNGSPAVQKYKNIVKPKVRNRSDSDAEILELVSSALKERKMLLFSLCTYRSHGITELERENDGYVREYLVRPISVMAHNGAFSLLGSLGDSGRMKFFPFDRIHGARLSDVDCQVMPNFPEGSSVYPENAAEERLPRGGSRSEITVKANREALFDIQSSFDDVNVQSIGENLFEVTFFCNLSSARRYLISLGDGVEAVSPPSLRGEVAATYFRMAERYRR